VLQGANDEAEDDMDRAVKAELAVKAGQRALRVLSEQGHKNVKLLQQHMWIAESTNGTTQKQLDVVATAADCVWVVEVSLVPCMEEALQLLSALQFLRCAISCTPFYCVL
jgi:hypothetical protein